MGLSDITFIGIGAMIGAGVFALTGFAAGLAGPALMVAFVLNGFVATLTALSYAELGAAIPRSGGAYNWVSEALPRPWGYYTGWTNWFAQAVACALYAVTFGVFLTEFVVVFAGLPADFTVLGFVSRTFAERALAGLVVAFFAYVNFRGAEETGRTGAIITAIKVMILFVFIVFGVLATVKEPGWPATFFASPSFAPAGAGGVMAAMGLTYVAFEGYDIIVQSGEEVMNPGRNIPRAIFISLAVVVPIYVLVAFAAIGGIDVAKSLALIGGGTDISYSWQILGKLGELGIIRAAGQFMPYGVPLLLVAGLAATMSALNATLYASSRIAYSMGRDRLLPHRLSEIHSQTRSPHLAIALSALLIAAMALTLPIQSVAAASSVMFILLFSMANVAAIAMRRNRPEMERPFRMPLMPWIPLVAIALQLVLTPFLLAALGLAPGEDGFAALVTMGGWLVLGVVVYSAYSEKKEEEKMEQEAPTVVVERRQPEARGYRVLVPVSNPLSARRLMTTAISLARDHDGEILVMSVVTVPQQTPLVEGHRFVDAKRALMTDAMSLAEQAGVPVSGTIRIGHDVAQAILNTIEQADTDAVILGWRGRSRRKDFVLGSNVDRVVTEAKCDVLVERIGPKAVAIRSILLPTAGGPHARFAAELARAIAAGEKARVDVGYVIAPGADQGVREAAQARIRGTAEGLEGCEVRLVLLEGSDVVETIVRASADYDLLLLGATREGLLRQLVLGAIPEEVGRRAKTTVIMAKKNVGLASLLTRWFRRR